MRCLGPQPCPQNDVSSSLELIMLCSIPTLFIDRISFIPFVHHKITLVVSGKRQQLIKTATSLTHEGPF